MLHWRLALPTAALLAWALQKLRPKAPPEPSAAPEADQDEGGKEVDVELPPAVKGPQLPFPEPAPLKAPLLDVTLPMPLPALWLSLFHAGSSLLSDFHQQLGDLEVRISPWRQQKGDDTPRRVLRYTTPLKNPLGPRQALNTEVLEAAQLTASGFCLRARCTSQGVPFAASFANHVQWVATPHGTHSTRLVVTGECRFHSPVWGPLKGQIERESIKGMAKAYRTLVHLLERQYGGAETGTSQPAGASSNKPLAAAPSGKLTRRKVALGADATAAGQAGGAARSAAAEAAAAAGPGADEGLNISALLQSPQTNAAAFLAIIVVMVLVWRLAFMHQAMMLQVARGVASAVRR